MAPRSLYESLDDTVERGNELHFAEAQASFSQELAILGVAAFLAASQDRSWSGSSA